MEVAIVRMKLDQLLYLHFFQQLHNIHVPPKCTSHILMKFDHILVKNIYGPWFIFYSIFLERSNTKKNKWSASEGVCRIETAGRFMKNRMN